MNTREKIVLGWSGGKDSSLALHELRKSERYEVVALLTTCTEGYDRISMHGVRCELLEQQARETGIPLVKVYISKAASNAEYEAKMSAVSCDFKRQGINTVAFGDLFLEDIRAYRDRMLKQIGMTAIYPVWGRDTRQLACEFVDLGFDATLVCIDSRALDKSFAGRKFSDALRDFPGRVDPCGENGEFHTFVFQGPIFQKPIPCQNGEVVERDGFYFSDLLANKASTPK